MQTIAKLPKSLQVIIDLLPNKRDYTIGNITSLDGKTVLGIVPTLAGISNSTKRDSLGTLIANNLGESGYLTLSNNKNNQLVEAVPFQILADLAANGNINFFENKEIDFTKSKITVDAANAGISNGADGKRSVQLTIIYQ